MNETKTMGFLANDVARDLAEARQTAQNADLRTLRDIELGWIGGGDDNPTWPVI